MSERSDETRSDALLPSPEQALMAATIAAREPRRSRDDDLLEALRTSRVFF
jgi:hypothetical protein